MVKSEYINNGSLVRHYSSAGFTILQEQTGIEYTETIDVVPCRYTYTETDNPVPTQDYTVRELAEQIEANNTANQLAIAELAAAVLGGGADG